MRRLALAALAAMAAFLGSPRASEAQETNPAEIIEYWLDQSDQNNHLLMSTPRSRPVPDSAVAVAHECLVQAGIPRAERLRVYWWEVDYMIFLPDGRRAEEFRGLTLVDTGHPQERHVLISLRSQRVEATEVHEAVHALCLTGCGHEESMIADACAAGRM